MAGQAWQEPRAAVTGLWPPGHLLHVFGQRFLKLLDQAVGGLMGQSERFPPARRRDQVAPKGQPYSVASFVSRCLSQSRKVLTDESVHQMRGTVLIIHKLRQIVDHRLPVRVIELFCVVQG